MSRTNVVLSKVEHSAVLLKREIEALVREKFPEYKDSANTVSAWEKINAGWKIEIGGILAVHLFKLLRLCEGLLLQREEEGHY